MVSYGIRLISAGHGPTYTQAGTGTPSPTPANGGASAVCWPEHGTISLFHRNFQKGLSLPLHWMGEGYGAGLMQPACSSAWPAIGQGRSLGEQSREDSGLVFQGNRLDSSFFIHTCHLEEDLVHAPWLRLKLSLAQGTFAHHGVDQKWQMYALWSSCYTCQDRSWGLNILDCLPLRWATSEAYARYCLSDIPTVQSPSCSQQSPTH